MGSFISRISFISESGCYCLMEGLVNIAYLIYAPYGPRDKRRFGVEALRRKGHLVQVWDFIEYFEKPKGRSSIHVPFIDSNHIKIKTKKEIVSFIKSCSVPTVVIPFFPYNASSRFIYKSLNENKFIKYVEFDFGRIPLPKHPVMDRIRSLTLDQIINWALRKFNFLMKNKTYDPKIYIITSSKGRAIKDEIAMYTHTLDYNVFIDEKESERRLISHDYAVFIDSGESGFSHPDLLMHHMKEFITPENYFREVNEYFYFFESKYRLPIVIAGHPRVNYLAGEYGSRKVIQGETHNLIRHSKIVLAHYSTSLNFAVIHKKPIICMRFSSNYRDCRNKRCPDSMINALDLKNVITLGKPDTFNKDLLFEINEKAYSDYKNEYIKHPKSEDVDTWVCFSSWLIQNKKKLFKGVA